MGICIEVISIKIDWFKLLFAVFICQMAGVIGGLFTSPSIPTWYSTIIKPAFTPPGWVFGPVWTTLYLLMGIALYLVWMCKECPKSNIAIYAFYVQLSLNILWSILFFGLHSIGAALVEIVLLWASIVVTIVLFWRVSKTAAVLLLPYLLWVTFAAFLNYQLFILN